MSSKPAIVITSIFHANAIMREIAGQCQKHGWEFVIAGDSKSPEDFLLNGATFLDIGYQRGMGKYGEICPERTYARKNLAYLHAIRQRPPFLVETDDDNLPKPEFWSQPSRNVVGRVVDGPGWVNAYQYFSGTFIYPRGYPINRAQPDWSLCGALMREESRDCPIQQGLADENPDVDAVYRMLHPLPFTFNKESPLVLDEGSWCPFNSQNTIFFPEVFPLLYLPATCSFRMTDIWRSFIAQRILWTCGWRLSFHSASVIQDRNDHNLLKDFEEEISGYLGNERIVEILSDLKLSPGVENMPRNLEICYAALIKENFFKPAEENLLAAWLDDLKE